MLDINPKYIDLDDNGNILLPNIKKIFLPDMGMEMLDGDLSGADAYVVAADSNCRFLLDFFANPKGKLYAYIASHHLQREITSESPEYKDYKAVCHGCLTGDHEVLTKNGWLSLEEYENLKIKTPIAIWDKDNFNIFFEIPSYFTKYIVDPIENLCLIEGDAFSQLTTLNHKLISYTNGKYKIFEAKDIQLSSRLPYVGNYIGGTKKETKEKMALIAALQADGNIMYIDKNNIPTFQFRFVKTRKIVRLEELLISANIPYSKNVYVEENKKVTSIRFKGHLDSWMKDLSWWILDYDKESLLYFINELPFWDGHIRKSNELRTFISTTNKCAAEIIQTLFQINGHGSKLITKERNAPRKKIYEVSTNNRKFHRVSSGRIRSISHKGTTVYCPTVSTGFFLIRRKGHISVTGNSNYGLGLDKLCTMLNIPYDSAEKLQKYYFTLCPEIRKWQEKIVKNISTKGYITNCFGRRSWFLNKNDPTLQNKAFAFIPQSTVLDVINRGWFNIRNNLSLSRYLQYIENPNKDLLHKINQLGDKIDVLLQVHDSLVVQYPIELGPFIRSDIKKEMEIPLPYGITIKADYKISTTSYGDMKKVS